MTVFVDANVLVYSVADSPYRGDRLSTRDVARSPRAGTNDRVHAATCLTNDIHTIVSTDAGFDGLRGLDRVDPADERSLGEVLHPG